MSRFMLEWFNLERKSGCDPLLKIPAIYFNSSAG